VGRLGGGLWNVDGGRPAHHLLGGEVTIQCPLANRNRHRSGAGEGLGPDFNRDALDGPRKPTERVEPVPSLSLGLSRKRSRRGRRKRPAYGGSPQGSEEVGIRRHSVGGGWERGRRR